MYKQTMYQKKQKAKICTQTIQNNGVTKKCSQGRSQDFSKGGAEVMEAKALKKKNCL